MGLKTFTVFEKNSDGLHNWCRLKVSEKNMKNIGKSKRARQLCCLVPKKTPNTQ